MATVMRRLCLVVTLVAAVSGCTVDQTSGTTKLRRCPVHGTTMTPAIIHMSSGESVYVWKYMEIVAHEFPNHGGTRLQGETAAVGVTSEEELDDRKWDRFASSVRDYACPDCTMAYEEYWKTHDWNGDARRAPKEPVGPVRGR
jgi:hypothetical protein